MPAVATLKQLPRLTPLSNAAEFAGTSVDTLRRMIVRGELKSYRIGQRGVRIDLDELVAVMAHNAGRSA